MYKKSRKSKLYDFVFESLARLNSFFDGTFLDRGVPLAELASHNNWKQHLFSVGNKKGKKILEVGSREVTGVSDLREGFSQAEYTGFDFYPGKNVDVVGDAHKLSSYFKKEEKFDIIFSSACFEHFAMPWVVSTEIAKILKVGGLVFIETHFSFSSHERPAHFFQFSDMALKVLFCQALGFECLEAGVSNPMIGRFSALADRYLRYKRITGLYCHSEFLGRKIKDVENFDWNGLNANEVVENTIYPLPR